MENKDLEALWKVMDNFLIESVEEADLDYALVILLGLKDIIELESTNKFTLHIFMFLLVKTAGEAIVMHINISE